MDINYFMKVQNAYGTKNRREKELVKVNSQMEKHFEDTFSTEDVLLNGKPFKLMIIKDTDGNTFKKKIKSPYNQKFNLGDYIEWNGQTWLVTLLDVDDRTWCRGYMYLCTVPLRWQNSDGEIVERFSYSEDFTKYSSGVVGNSTISIGDNQYGLTLPIDRETKKLKRDMRFPIDFEDAESPDVYALTNRKVSLNNNEYFGRGGTMILTLSLEAFNSNTDFKVEFPEDSGKEVWICDYKKQFTTLPPSSPSDETTISKAVVTGNENLKIGFARTYIAELYDKNGDIVDWDNSLYSLRIVSDFTIEQDVTDNKIKIFVENEELIGSSFLLQIVKLNSNAVISEKEVTIVEF